MTDPSAPTRSKADIVLERISRIESELWEIRRHFETERRAELEIATTPVAAVSGHTSSG